MVNKYDVYLYIYMYKYNLYIIQVLEASLQGTKLRPLEDRLRYSKSNQIAVRRLQIQKTHEFYKKALEYCDIMSNKLYEERIDKFFNGIDFINYIYFCYDIILIQY